MVSVGLSEILLALVALLLLSVVAAMFATWSWLILRLVSNRPILPVSPMVPERQTPWGIGSAALAIVVYLAVNTGIMRGYALETGRLRTKPAAVLPKTVVAGSESPTFLPSELMALSVVGNTVLLVLIPLLLRRTCGARLRDFGISFRGWWRQAALGCVATLAAAPIVYLIQMSATKVWKSQEHPLQKMLMKEFSPGIPELAILSAVIAAPLLEELLFRGIIQSWLVRLTARVADARSKPRIDELGVELAQVPALSPGADGSTDFWAADSGEFIAAPVHQVTARELKEKSSPAWGAIVATSLFFAAVHGAQWPAPLGLFVLAVVIGTVFYRTGSLIAVIVMHATFNGISTLMLFYAVLATDIGDSKKQLLPTGQTAPIHSALTMNSGWMH